ncbi:MAG TPA: hypothetical protein VGS41_10030, partial [Chthonomonadales bacterium]|nr:hypothetical protein [Chthonomonadales bacterium]
TGVEPADGVDGAQPCAARASRNKRQAKRILQYLLSRPAQAHEAVLYAQPVELSVDSRVALTLAAVRFSACRRETMYPYRPDDGLEMGFSVDVGQRRRPARVSIRASLTAPG